MSAVPGGGVRLAPAPPGATRRTTTISIAPRDSWAAGQWVAAVGRDLVRAPDGDLRVDQDELSFAIDAGGLIVPDAAGRSVPEELRGQSAQRGLRKSIARLRDQGIDLVGSEGSLRDAILDDVVGTSLASGYGRLYEGSLGRDGGDISTGMRMTCIGFSTMHARGEEFDVRRYFEKKQPSIDFVAGDDLAWHEDLPMRPTTFRRRRMLQVAPAAAGIVAVTGYFRDTFMRPDGVEMVVHEYGVNATVVGDPPTLASVEVVPGSLPLDHCPLAARSAQPLEGLPLSEIEETVRGRLAGAGGCTHLNDELRALRLVPSLLAAQA